MVGAFQTLQNDVARATADAVRRNADALAGSLSQHRASRDAQLQAVAPPSKYVVAEVLEEAAKGAAAAITAAFGDASGAGLVGKEHWPKVDALQRETAKLYADATAGSAQRLRAGITKASVEFEAGLRLRVAADGGGGGSGGSRQAPRATRYVPQEALAEAAQELKGKVGE
jgi:hypothetical protein